MIGMRVAEDVEALLSRDRRSRLPFARQILLYLDPFAFFKDASRGEHALSYNRAMRWMLVPYLRRWIMIAATLFLCIAPAEALAAQTALFIVPTAALAVGFCIAVAVIACIAAAWLLLGASRSVH